MRWMGLTLTFLLLCIGCEQPVAPYEPPAPIVSPAAVPQTVEEMDRLTGIAQVQLNPDGSVTLVNEENTGEGIYLMMYDDSGRVTNATTLQVGQSVQLTDGRHVAIWYTLTNVNNDRLLFQVTGRFDARAFGGDVNIYRKTVSVSPY